MKTNALTRIYALTMSALFASVATLGVAAMMAYSGELARTELTASATASHSSPSAASALVPAS
jgi:hypothetical protein